MEKRAAEDRERRLQEETLAYSERMKATGGMAASGSTQPPFSAQEVSGTGLPGTEEMRRRFEHFAATIAEDSGAAKVWAKVLKDFKGAPAKDWHIPTGFQERFAPEEKRLMDCLFVRSAKDAAEALDRATWHSKIFGFVNTTVCELWARQLYSTEVGSAKVKRQADWLKPRADNRGWKSKVDFDMPD